MAVSGRPSSEIVRQLDLNAEQQAALGEVISASVAVNVYRQLQNAGVSAADSSGCNIIGNCSSCSKAVAVS